MFDQHVHPSDRGAILRGAASSPSPGSIEEAEALLRIDEARCDDLDTISGRADRRRRRELRRYWSDRGAQLA